MKKTKNFSILAAVLIAAMSVVFTSCGKDDKIEVISSEPIMGKWHILTDGQLDQRYYFELKTDNSYSYVSENGIIEGHYKITESEKIITFRINEGTLSDGITFIHSVEGVSLSNFTLFKMLVSGGSDFDQMWVYYSGAVFVQLYSGNKFVRFLGSFLRTPDDR
jgi:hypothetical protein